MADFTCNLADSDRRLSARAADYGPDSPGWTGTYRLHLTLGNDYVTLHGATLTELRAFAAKIQRAVDVLDIAEPECIDLGNLPAAKEMVGAAS